MVAVSAEAVFSTPCPSAGVTITGLGVGSSVVSVWRTADGERSPVRGARRAIMNDASYVVDYDAPLGRPVTYEVEVLAGPSGSPRVTAAPVTIASDTGWILDPLIPQSAVEITRRYLPSGQPTFAVSAMSKLEYASDVQLFKVLGSNKPLALFGQRMAAAGVDFSMITDAAEQNSRLRDLLQSTAQLLIKLPPAWSSALPGACFASVAKVSEAPLTEPDGGTLTAWDLSGDVVAAPTIRVLTATFTYGDVQLLASTYQQKQDAFAGLTYLDDLKNPLG